MIATGVHVPAVSLAVRARDVIGCEWIKFRSVRSTFWTLLVAVVTPVAISVLVAFTLATAPGQGGPAGRPAAARPASAWSTRCWPSACSACWPSAPSTAPA